MSEIETTLALLAATTALVAVARRLGIPYPILLVMGGLAISFIPGLPRIELDPEVFFVLVLPPMLQSAAFFTPARDFRAQLRPILSLAIGLVLFSTCAIAVVAHSVVDALSWPSAFVLGAVVSPTDAVAATSIASRMGLPRRVVAILEGESLLNDATALVTYRVAVTAAVTGTFSVTDAFGSFVLAALGGIVVGVVVGWVATRLMLRTEDPSIGIAISLLVPYAAYLTADQANASGVLAVVVGGFLMSRNFSRVRSPEARVQGIDFWDMFIFLLNGFVFILIGLQLPDVLDGIAQYSWTTLLFYAAMVCGTAILVRIAWVFLTSDMRRGRGRPALSCTPNTVSRRELAFIAWAGMRGAISLAAALALGSDVPGRHLIVFLTFALILVTLVVQGLTLAPFIQWLGIGGDEVETREELAARSAVVRAGRTRLDELANEDWVLAEVLDDLVLHADRRAGRLEGRLNSQDGDESEEDFADVFKRLQREFLSAEQDEALRLRDEGVINDETLRRIQRDIDVELIRLQRI